jgi:hypothetical protein
MLKTGLLAGCATPREYLGLGWRQDEKGAWIVLRITATGLRAIGVDPAEGATVADMALTIVPAAEPAPLDVPAAEAIQGASLVEEVVLVDAALATPTTAPWSSLRNTAATVLAAWDDEADCDAGIVAALGGLMKRLRALLPGRPVRASCDAAAPRKPRAGTKQEQVLIMLHRLDGATVAQIAKSTGRAQHTVRGFFAGLKKKGLTIEVLERVRQVGSSKEGARGSFTIYRTANPA